MCQNVLMSYLTCCSPYPAYPGLPRFLFAILKFGFNNLIHLSYHILLPTNKGTSSLRKSVLILTRSDFEEVNVVTCWDKECDSYHLNLVSVGYKLTKGLIKFIPARTSVQCSVCRTTFGTVVRYRCGSNMIASLVIVCLQFYLVPFKQFYLVPLGLRVVREGKLNDLLCIKKTL